MPPPARVPKTVLGCCPAYNTAFPLDSQGSQRDGPAQACARRNGAGNIDPAFLIALRWVPPRESQPQALNRATNRGGEAVKRW